MTLHPLPPLSLPHRPPRVPPHQLHLAHLRWCWFNQLGCRFAGYRGGDGRKRSAVACLFACILLPVLCPLPSLALSLGHLVYRWQDSVCMCAGIGRMGGSSREGGDCKMYLGWWLILTSRMSSFAHIQSTHSLTQPANNTHQAKKETGLFALYLISTSTHYLSRLPAATPFYSCHLHSTALPPIALSPLPPLPTPIVYREQ